MEASIDGDLQANSALLRPFRLPLRLIDQRRTPCAKPSAIARGPSWLNVTCRSTAAWPSESGFSLSFLVFSRGVLLITFLGGVQITDLINDI
jgi:hypothetical protein